MCVDVSTWPLTSSGLHGTNLRGISHQHAAISNVHCQICVGLFLTSPIRCCCRPIELLKRDSRSKQHPDVQPDGPLCVLHGSDTFRAIGLPEGQNQSSTTGMVTAWRNHLRAACPAPTASSAEPPAIASLLADDGALRLTYRTFLYVCIHVCRLSHIGRICMDIDNSRVAG
jgi:hypothetical protein